MSVEVDVPLKRRTAWTGSPSDGGHVGIRVVVCNESSSNSVQSYGHVSRVSQTRDALTVFSAVRCDTSTILLEPSPSINFMKLDSSIRAPPPTRAIDRYPSRDLGLTHPLTTVPVKRLVRASFAGSLFLYPSEFPQPAGRPETQPPRHRISCRGFGRGRSCPSNLGCRHPQWAGDGCIETDA